MRLRFLSLSTLTVIRLVRHKSDWSLIQTISNSKVFKLQNYLVNGTHSSHLRMVEYCGVVTKRICHLQLLKETKRLSPSSLMWFQQIGRNHKLEYITKVQVQNTLTT